MKCVQKGTTTFPSLINMTVENKIQGFLDSLLEAEPQYFCVNLKIKSGNNIKIFLDGDAGIPIEKCVRFNRSLYKLIEEEAMFAEGDFSLEVSSPGIDEPLKMHRQYTKNIGREVEVIFTDDAVKLGKLLEVTEADIIIEETTGKGKKAVTEQVVIPFQNIKSTTVQIKF